MQWLELMVRFVEEDAQSVQLSVLERQWLEFKKVGEVVQHMRLINRKYFVEMITGSAGIS